MVDDDFPRAYAPGLTRKPSSATSSRRGAPRNRDLEDFEELYRAQAVPLARFVIIACSASPEDAWDAVQAAFTAAWTKWGEIAPLHRSRKAWLRTTAMREYLRQIPERRRRAGEPVPDAPGTDLLPEAVFALEQSTAEVRQALATLPMMQRLHLTWHLDGYTYAEIATHTGRKQPAVRKNVSRALETLRKTLGGGAP